MLEKYAVFILIVISEFLEIKWFYGFLAQQKTYNLLSINACLKFAAFLIAAVTTN